MKHYKEHLHSITTQYKT